MSSSVRSSDSHPSTSSIASHLPPVEPRLPSRERLIISMMDRLASHEAPHQAESPVTQVVMLDEQRSAKGLGWRDSARLGPFLGRGQFHRVHAIDLPGPDHRDQDRWIALIAKDDKHARPEDRLHTRLMRALREHDHADALSTYAADLLPHYAGFAALLRYDTQNRAERDSRMFGTIWQHKDGVFQDVVSKGGLAGGAFLGQHPFTANDLGMSMLSIGRAFQTLHGREMVYTDAKPANIAFSIAQDEHGHRAEVGRGAHRALPFLSSRIRDVVFIDPESMQLPGYARDPSRSAVGILTPAYASAGLLRGAMGTDQAFKDAQANPANDVFHTAAIAYSLATGKIAQYRKTQALLRRLHEKPGAERPMPHHVVFNAHRMIRLNAGFDHERSLLEAQVSQKRLPQAMVRVIVGGLNGSIRSLAEWERQTLAAAS